ncbi:DEAD-domain-containing protein [Gorgonomyces haynaldii]|nr:DEAD-domain-containing protein [Gorgonomyces haynaldii]
MPFDPLSIKTVDSDQEDNVSEQEDIDPDFSFDLDAEPLVKKEPIPEPEDNDSEHDSELEMEEDIVKDKVQKVDKKKLDEYFEEAPTQLDRDTFTSLNLSRPILRAITQMGFVKPTDIQQQAIPLGLQGKDICGSAQTGSGKTLAFMVPVLERLLFKPRQPAVRVLVLVPTRELGVQCQQVSMKLAQFTSIQIALLVGGLSTKIQAAELKKNPDVIIATPGRLIDHIHNSSSFTLDHIEILIMDEADRMLEDGFKAELTEIIKHTPKKRQTMLFSATMTDNVDELIQLSLTRPMRLHVDSNQAIAHKLTQEFIRVREHREEARPAILVSLCARTYTSNCIIFFRSKAAAHHMKIVFELAGLKASELHGNLSQPQRIEALEKFKSGESKFLLCTDLASRGLDISGVKTVINYDMPNTYQVYVHRVGRTARAEQKGRAVSLVGEQGRPILKLAIQNATQPVKHRIIPAQVIAKYEEEIAALQDKIKEVYQSEKEDRAMTEVEMQMKKAENILEHDVYSRPKKEWFQAEKPKEPKQEKEAQKRAPMSGLSRKKKRLKMARETDKKEMAQQKVAAKHSKRKNLPTKIQQAKPSGGVSKKKGSIFGKEMKKR